jgi:hypothetical protein
LFALLVVVALVRVPVSIVHRACGWHRDSERTSRRRRVLMCLSICAVNVVCVVAYFSDAARGDAVRTARVAHMLAERQRQSRPLSAFVPERVPLKLSATLYDVRVPTYNHTFPIW